MEQLTEAQKKTPKAAAIAVALVSLTTALLIYHVTFFMKTCQVLRKGLNFLIRCYEYFRINQIQTEPFKPNKEEIQSLVTEFLEKNLKQLCGEKPREDVPVQLLWQGANLAESSIHCNIREDAEVKHLKQLAQSKTTVKSSEIGGGDEMEESVTLTSSDESTTQKIAEIRKLLESEPDIIKRFEDKYADTDDLLDEVICETRPRPREEPSAGETAEAEEYHSETEVNEVEEVKEVEEVEENETAEEISKESLLENLQPDFGDNSSSLASDTEQHSHPKLMNRIRLLESRLRLEELKNRNWIQRMSRAEGILQQLNKQVSLHFEFGILPKLFC